MRIEYSAIPAGDKFLPGTSKAYLCRCHREESDPNVRERLLAFIMRKDGMAIRPICDALNRPFSTVRNWLIRAVQLGVTGRYGEVRRGSECRLDPSQLARLRTELIAGPRACGFESGIWTCRIAVEHVRKRYGIQYRERGMWDLLGRLGFSSRKSRSRHPKAASKRSMDAFKKKPGAVPDITPQKNT